MNIQLLVIFCWIINLQHILQTMGETILKQSTNYRHHRLTIDASKPTGIRDIVLSELFSNERDPVSSESHTEATRLRQTRQLRQSSESNRRQSRRESQLQELEALFTNSHNGHRHTSSWKKQSSRLFRQMVAQNVTSSQASAVDSGEDRRVYATIHIEANKLPQYTCPAGYWACSTPKRGRVTCIEEEKRCDYHIDCPRGDDEQPDRCADYRLFRSTMREQQQEIETLRSQMLLLMEKHKCDMHHLKSQLLDHSHVGPHVRIDYNVQPEETCGGGET